MRDGEKGQPMELGVWILRAPAPPPAGEAVSEGDPLCEVETDKAEITMDCDQDAVVARILVSRGRDHFLHVVLLVINSLFDHFPPVCCMHV